MVTNLSPQIIEHKKDNDIIYADGNPVPGLLLEMYYFVIIKQYIL